MDDVLEYVKRRGWWVLLDAVGMVVALVLFWAFIVVLFAVTPY